MGSDRARVSYDPKQQYRSVVMQQGRVTLEADFNEELAIAGEELRKETLDIVGPSGTPDNGYLITPLSTGPFDFSIGAGTMYVGGLRVATPPPVPPPSAPAPAQAQAANASQYRYLNQQEWLDHADDPDWVDINPQTPPTTEFVYLFLREQEVSAVEDSDLKDVALGGPDTAQRTRLLQHVVRLSVPDPTCLAGLDAAKKDWKSEGLTFNAQNMRLESTASLEVSFSPTGPKPDPCNPQAQGGYLGADNQLIRVQISGVDPVSKKPKFVWGYDDASFLYRIDLDTSNKQLLHLQSRPVDASHQPQAQQAVEALRSAAELSNGEYVASLSGVVFTLDKAYNPDTQMITLPASMTQLPAEFYDSSQTPRVFLRVWEQEIIFTPGTAVSLGDTGLQVTLKAPGNVFHIGDYWLFAVRPSTPQQVYPEHYLNAFQPPDGPRMWVCPLGVITWNGQKGNLAEDCRNFFDNLVDLTKRKGQGGCCTVSVNPKDVIGNSTLQSIVDQLVTPAIVLSAADPGSPGNDIFLLLGNVIPDADPLKTQVSVELLDTHTYTGLALANIQSKLAASTGLVHVSGQVTQGLAPKPGRFQLKGGDANTKASIAISNVQSGTAFTLEAKKAGAAGNNTIVEIANPNAATGTFDLSVGYIAVATAITLSQLGQNSNPDLAYDVRFAPPSGGFATPLAGITPLTGGKDGKSPVAASATIYADQQTKVCLGAGVYSLPKTLELGIQHSGLTLESCGGEAILSAADGAEANFLQGLVMLNAAVNVTFSGLTFNLPPVPFVKAGGTLAGLNATQLNQVNGPEIEDLIIGVGLRPLACSNLTVEDCTFNFQVAESGVFEAGILASGNNSGFVLENNQFSHQQIAKLVTENAFSVTIGYLLTPSVTLNAPTVTAAGGATFHTAIALVDTGASSPTATPAAGAAVTGTSAPVAARAGATGTTAPAATPAVTAPAGATGPTGATAPAGVAGPAATVFTTGDVNVAAGVAADKTINGTVLESALTAGLFENNRFTGLTAAAVIYATSSELHFESNTVRNCYSGFWVLSLQSIPFPDEFRKIQELGPALVADPVLFIGSSLGRAYPLPPDFQVKPIAVNNAPAPNGPPSNLTNDQLRRYYRLQFGLAALEKAASPMASPGLSLNASLNDVQAIQAGASSSALRSSVGGGFVEGFDQSSCGFVVWLGQQDLNTHVVLSGNTVYNNTDNVRTVLIDRVPGLPTVAVLAAVRAAITGNQIINFGNAEGTSLALDPVPSQTPTPFVAITGNVLQRPAFYPLRAGFTPALQPPFNSWDFMNTVIL